MPPAVKTAEATRPLDAAERKQIEELLARASAESDETPSTRFGTPYVALTNLSVPRRSGNKEENDLVMAGETVNLTDDEAAKYMRHGVKDGRQISVIRPATGPESSNLKPQTVPPRAVSGRLQAPPPPAPGTDGPRPDPAGSSQIQYAQPAEVPEAAEPQAGTENAGWTGPDAEDILPSRTRARPTGR
jgi:hypothetical protein